MKAIKPALNFYGVLFFIGGIAFVFGRVPFMQLFNSLGERLLGASPIGGNEPSLWLGLAGSLMVSISYLAFSLADNPKQAAAWNALLLSKGVSTALFTIFSISQRNTLFLLGAAADAPIFIHLWFLSRDFRAENPIDSLRSRLPTHAGHFYEAWFAKFNDPVTRNALWIRYTLIRGKTEEASCWYVLFDRSRGAPVTGRFDAPLAELAVNDGHRFFQLKRGWIAPGFLHGSFPNAGWDFRWNEEPAPVFHFVSPLLKPLARSEYQTSVSAARFDGTAVIEGREYRFEKAPGCVGHLWGSRMAEDWFWGQAIFEGEQGVPSVFEILGARVKVGRKILPRLVSANLWHCGRHFPGNGLHSLFANRLRRERGRWLFEIDFGDCTLEGECEADPARTVELIYRDVDGRRLKCRNSKTGRMRVRVVSRAGGLDRTLATEDAAAVEFTERLP